MPRLQRLADEGILSRLLVLRALQEILAHVTVGCGEPLPIERGLSRAGEADEDRHFGRHAARLRIGGLQTGHGQYFFSAAAASVIRSYDLPSFGHVARWKS